MRIIRHTAPNMRQALREIRERLGEDAVILSSRRTPEGIEVSAGAEVEAGLAADAPADAGNDLPGASRPQSEPPPPAAAAACVVSAPLASQAAARTTPERDAAPPADSLLDALAPVGPQRPVAVAGVAAVTDSISQELRGLRRLLETQLEQLAWSDLTRRLPVHAALLRELTEIGIGQELAERIAQQLPAGVDLAHARRFAFTALSQYLRVTGDLWPEHGGRVAFLGAAGVGKTTSLAKIAVRWVLRHGARDLALVAADPVRVGARDQLHSLGQLLGAAVHALESFAELPALMTQLTRFRLVLIDTPGLGAQDPQFTSRLSVLASSASQLESVLVLSASTQAGALEDAVQRFAPANPSCALLTKLDESASLGGTLSVLMRTQLRLAYVSDGQRVPEDLRPARALELISQAVRMAKASGATADEDLLRRRFGRAMHVNA